jgi:hypothetical protein
MMPYVKSNAVFRCPSSSSTLAPSPDAQSNALIPRSYVANCAVENLKLSAVEKPSETLALTEKWDVDLVTGAANNEKWLEPYDGDMNPSPADGSKMIKIANRHQDGMECTFMDGHAKWLKPDQIWNSAQVSGCNLIHQSPGPAPTDICDQTLLGCGTATAANLCNKFY